MRDDESGLVWEKTLEAAEMSWSDACTFCADKDVGRRKGWHVWCVCVVACLRISIDVAPLGLDFFVAKLPQWAWIHRILNGGIQLLNSGLFR